jgi:hypothetical protein
VALRWAELLKEIRKGVGPCSIRARGPDAIQRAPGGSLVRDSRHRVAQSEIAPPERQRVRFDPTAKPQSGP